MGGATLGDAVSVCVCVGCLCLCSYVYTGKKLTPKNGSRATFGGLAVFTPPKPLIKFTAQETILCQDLRLSTVGTFFCNLKSSPRSQK